MSTISNIKIKLCVIDIILNTIDIIKQIHETVESNTYCTYCTYFEL